MNAHWAPAKQDDSIPKGILIVLGVFLATIILMLGYLSIAARAEVNAAKNSHFYAQCQQELATATYGRIGDWHIDPVCFHAAIGQARHAHSKHATAIKAALLPTADAEYLETQYLNQTRRHAPESWNPLGIPMYLD